jgi:hypothetical protein
MVDFMPLRLCCIFRIAQRGAKFAQAVAIAFYGVLREPRSTFL